MTGDHRTIYEEWVRAHGAELYRFAYRLTGGVQAAEDLVQETFVAAWRSMGKLREPEKARGWLFQILRNCHARGRRTEGRRMEGQPGRVPVTDALPAPDQCGHAAERDFLEHGLRQLDGRLRETFLMVTMEGLTCREAAEKLSTPVGTVLSRLHRARQHLRVALSPAAGTGGRP